MEYGEKKIELFWFVLIGFGQKFFLLSDSTGTTSAMTMTTCPSDIQQIPGKKRHCMSQTIIGGHMKPMHFTPFRLQDDLQVQVIKIHSSPINASDTDTLLS
jgi:hypothetical protein